MVAESYFGLAQCYHQAKRLSQARDAYKQAISAGGDVVEPALLQLGLVESSLGNFAAAQQAADQLIANYPAGEFRDRAQLGRGYALYKQGQYPKAVAAFSELLARPGVEIDAAYLLGLSQSATGDWPAAAKTLQGIQLDDSHALAAAVAYHTGDALLRTGKLDDAAAAFDRVVQQHADSAWADDSLLGKARVAIEQQDAASSLALADSFLEKFPESPLAQQARLAKGQALAALEKPEEAIKTLEPLLNDTAVGQQANDLRDRVQSIVAEGQAKLGDFDKARQAVEQLAQDPASSELANELKVRVGEMAQAAGKSDVANELLAGVTEGSKQLTDRAKQSLGWSYFEAGRWEEAAAAFDEIIQSGATGPEAAEALLLKARALEHLQKVDEALSQYQEVVDKYPDTPRAAEALHRAAQLLETRGSEDQARSLYGQLLDKFPEYAATDEVLLREAWLTREKDPKVASQILERIRSEFATSRVAPEATMQLSELLVQEGKLDQAAELLREITRPDAPASIRPRALYLEGQLELARQNFDGALRPLEQLMREHPDSDEALTAEYLQAEVAYRKGEYQQATQLFAQLNDKTQGRHDSWLPMAELRRAQALAQTKQWTEAAEIAKSLSGRFPEFAEQYEADYLIGRTYAAQAEFDAARSWYAKAIAAPQARGSETAAMAQWMIGESYFHQQQYAAALGEYMKVGSEYARWHAAALLQAGKSQEALGRWEDAASSYAALVNTYPDSSLAAEANQRLTAARARAAVPLQPRLKQ
jgi:TolA-binding protein